MHAALKIAAVAWMIAACEDRPKTDVPPPEPSGEPAKMAMAFDASAFATDPPAPAGDLKTELEQFVNLDTCVAAKAKLDPLVGDALGAIGYDTFLRDACRMLEAAKDKKRETCERIDSSPLRRRCETWVAMVAQTPDACPLQFDGYVARGRVVSCVAIAARDPRLCAGEVLSSARGTCEAMVARDPAKCSVLRQNQRPACEREVQRWKSTLSSPLEGLDKLPPIKAMLTLGDRDAGTATAVDLGLDVANGVVLVTSKERARIEMGSLVESEASRIGAGPNRRARLGLALISDGKPSLQKLELVVPNEAPYVSPPATCDCKITGVRIEPKRGSAVSFTIEGKLSAGTRTQEIAVDVTTWVRDVVPDSEGAGRMLPVIHPMYLRDGG